MDAPALPINSKILRRAADADEYGLYKAALEWGLADPIIINSRDDLKSESRWKDRVEPFYHQVTNLINFCRRLPVTLLADDVGLGKTISAGLIASELISRKRVTKALIVCPKLLGDQWREELQTKFNIPAKIAIGKDLLEAEPPEDTGAVITTYHSARLYIHRIPAGRFQMLILDEAHKFRNLYGADKPPKVAVRFRQVLADRMFKYVLMLTATPIQNRLWDLYSLVDLLTVARGHENPFGATGLFKRNFIADTAEQARHLRPEMRDRFRSIVYGYMSRVRRAGAKLQFPERTVLLQAVPPSSGELELIRLIAKPILPLNRLAQITILQALASSPDALASQLENSARNGTFPEDVACDVRALVKVMPRSAKLDGLAALVAQLRKEKPESWRMVVFTGRRETQTTIEAYLQEQGISVGIINGSTGARNAGTIKRFKQNPPGLNVIVSTEAGSEGVNLQAANVLVNYDLPWNPMIVEQRIGRVQRLASEHAKVFVYSVILRGTFEEYIVARLMEKLQMASHAIGDVEALLEAAGMAEGEDGPDGFEEQIRKLVLDSLAGIDVAAATKLAEESIAKAKITLAEEEERINTLLGGMDDAHDYGPRGPELPPQTRSIDAREFVLKALQSIGGQLEPLAKDLYALKIEGRQEMVALSEEAASIEQRTVLYTPGSSAFDRLAGRLSSSGLHGIDDLDASPPLSADLIHGWAEGFQGAVQGWETNNAAQGFEGNALVQVRALVAHDSYERLLEVPCTPDVHYAPASAAGRVILHMLDAPQAVGGNLERIVSEVRRDPSIAEFCRFYLERRQQEIAAAGEDLRKRKKLEDDFTPRVEAALVGLRGKTYREVNVRVRYTIDGEGAYQSEIGLVPSQETITRKPRMGKCSKTARRVPVDCLGKCAITGERVIQHFLVESAVSRRVALAEYSAVCELTGETVLADEAAVSDISRKTIALRSLRTSKISGKRAEPQFFGRCAFTGVEALDSELAVSEVSAKKYRADQRAASAISGTSGHISEFTRCAETGGILLPTETERCAVTGKTVLPGLLETCSVSNKKVLAGQLERSVVSGAKALRRYFVTSSVSGGRLLEQEGVQSLSGQFCAPQEAKPCAWGGKSYHPDDVETCTLTGLPMHVQYLTSGKGARGLDALQGLLSGIRRDGDRQASWSEIVQKGEQALRGRWRIESAQLSPDGHHLAACAEVKSLLGFRVHHVGIIYSLDQKAVVGRFAEGKRKGQDWLQL
jgi:superfamily II DNA or RNA helicase